MPTVRSMRRITRIIGAIVAAGIALVGAPGSTPPAGAHFCSSPLQVPVGEKVTFTVGVPAEEAVVGRVEIEVPENFDLHRAIERPPWKVTQEGQVVTFTGGPLPLFQCAFFTLAGVAEEKEKLIVPFTTFTPEGEKIREFRSEELNHLDAAQLVYAGLPTGPEISEPGEGPPSWLAPAGWALIGIAVAGGFVLLVRRRQSARA